MPEFLSKFGNFRFFPQNMVTCLSEKNPFVEVATGFLFFTNKNLAQEKILVTTSAEKGW
jgi:hypothetical protein